MRITESQLRRIVKRAIVEAGGSSNVGYFHVYVKKDYMPLNQMLKKLSSLGLEPARESDGTLVEPFEWPRWGAENIDVLDITVKGDVEVLYDGLADGTLDFIVGGQIGGSPLYVDEYKDPDRLDQAVRQMSSGGTFKFKNDESARNQFKVYTYINSLETELVKKMLADSIKKCGFNVLKYDGPERDEYAAFVVQGDAQKFISAIESGKCPVEIPDPKEGQKVGIQVQRVEYINRRNMVSNYRVPGADMSSLYA